MHALAKVMFPPTAVEHALCCDFINHSPKSLVVAGANVLRVFQLIPDISVSSKGYHQYTGMISMLKYIVYPIIYGFRREITSVSSL